MAPRRSLRSPVRVLNFYCLSLSSCVAHAIEAKKGGKRAELDGRSEAAFSAGRRQPQETRGGGERSRRGEASFRSQPERFAARSSVPASAILPWRCRIETVPDPHAAKQKNGQGSRAERRRVLASSSSSRAKTKKLDSRRRSMRHRGPRRRAAAAARTTRASTTGPSARRQRLLGRGRGAKP